MTIVRSITGFWNLLYDIGISYQSLLALVVSLLEKDKSVSHLLRFSSLFPSLILFLFTLLFFTFSISLWSKDLLLFIVLSCISHYYRYQVQYNYHHHYYTPYCSYKSEVYIPLSTIGLIKGYSLGYFSKF